MLERLLTSWHLEYTALSGAELHARYIYLDPPVAHIEDHVHLLRVLGFLDTAWGKFDDSRADERRAQQLREAEGGVFDVSCLDARRSIGDVYNTLGQRTLVIQ